MFFISATLLATLSSSAVLGDLASLRRFAQGGPPPPAGARQVSPSGSRQSSSPATPLLRASTTQPPREATLEHKSRHQDRGLFFPSPSGSKVIKHLILPKVPSVKSNATPIPTPVHSTLMKILDQSGPESSAVVSDTGFAASNSGNLESLTGLVRIPKDQVNNPSQLQNPIEAPAPRFEQNLPFQPAQPAFVRIPKPQPNNPDVPTIPSPQAQHVNFEHELPSLSAADNIEVATNPPQLSDEELELEAAVSMIRNNWEFVKAGGRLILSHRDDDPIIVAKDSLFRQ